MEKWLIYCLSLFTILSCSKQSSKEEKVAGTDCDLAELLYDQKGNQGSSHSQLYLDSAIRICPDFSKAYREKGVPYLKRGDYSTWFQYLNKAIELDPQSFLVIRAWCRTKFLHDYKGALEDFKAWDTMFEPGPRMVADNSIYSWMALCYAGLGDNTKALQCIDKSIEDAVREHGSEWVGLYDYFYRGNIKLAFNDFDGALADFDRQTELTDKIADVYYYKSIALLQLGRKKAAKEALFKARSLFINEQHIHDPYVEMPWQIWQEDIEEKIQVNF